MAAPPAETLIAFMQEGSPMLLPLLRSRAQGDILAWIMLHPEDEFSLVEIGRVVRVSGSTVMREGDRLAEAGLIRQVRRGNQRMVRAETESPVFAPLAALLAVTFGPAPVLRELLSEVAEVRQAWIYGSWAARYAQRPGPVPEDIDVLVVGTADLDVLDDIARTASERLGREVSIRRVKMTVTSRPMVALIGGEST